MNAYLLVVPVRVDVLLAPSSVEVASPMADFTRLPYFDGERDVNTGTPFIGEAIASEPFASSPLSLRPGAHLHWTLPDVLTRADVSGSFLPIPNRWLVVRTRKGAVEARSVVESDYLHPEGGTDSTAAVSYPVIPGATAASQKLSRFLGRNVALASWSGSSGGAEYLPPGSLTALGYGEPTFAALYPNCFSVLGFFDAIDPSDVDGVGYEVFGWYESADPIARVVSEIDLPSDWDPHTLTGILCHGSVILGVPPQTAQTTASADVLALGNTGVEALAALVANTQAGESDGRSKAVLEDQLLALLYAAQWAHRNVDRGAAFEEAKHRKRFTTTAGGSLWTVRPVHGAPKKADAAASASRTRVPLPTPLATQLDALSRLQQAYDRATDDLASLRAQVFADWYKYMSAAYPEDGLPDDYPNIDEIRFFIEERSLREVDAKAAATGTLTVQVDGSGRVTASADKADAPLSLAARLAASITTAQSMLDAAYPPHPPQPTDAVRYTLHQVPAPRYYGPNDPVALVTGDSVRGSGRLTTQGTATYRRIPSPGALTTGTALDTVRQDVLALGVPAVPWAPPWNPFLLEWEVEYFPLARSTATPDYPSDFLTRRFQLAASGVDLTPETVSYKRGACLYRGRSLLTPGAFEHLVAALEGYLVGAYCDATKQARPSRDALPAFIEKHGAALRQMASYEQNGKLPSWLGASFLTTLISAYELVSSPGFLALSQSLGGFHAALRGQKQALQIPVMEPVGFEDARAFSARVAAAVGRENRTAPQPQDTFEPVRAGLFQVTRLRLVDTFGQTRDLGWTDVVTSESFAAPAFEGLSVATLAPSFTQPARLSLRWLSADHDHRVEVNAHPETDPICGWLVPNYLDQSVLLYDRDGNGIGLFDVAGVWTSMPGGGDGVDPKSWNPHLARLQRWIGDRIAQQGAGFLQMFLTTLDSALGNIAPDTTEEHAGLALLMGRPLALVRASVALELQGHPAVDPSWAAFRADLGRDFRETQGFTGVRVPLRLGEYARLDDGLVGYWSEDELGQLDETFRSPESAGGGPVPPLAIAVEDGALAFSLLMDPRGTLHATTGILPAKSISLPREFYAGALRAIAVSFLSAPILTDTGTIELPLPAEPGYVWSFCEMQGTTWHTVAAVAPPATNARFSGPKELRDGWLILQPNASSPRDRSP